MLKASDDHINNAKFVIQEECTSNEICATCRFYDDRLKECMFAISPKVRIKKHGRFE